jgi:hypothetical protein
MTTTTQPARWTLTRETLPEVFEAVPGKPFWAPSRVITGYRVFTGRRGESEVANWGDVIERVGRDRWRVIPAKPLPLAEPLLLSTATDPTEEPPR